LVNAVLPPSSIEIKEREKNMRGATVIADIVYKTVSTLGSLRQPAEFTCGDCERWARCGMPSSVDCIFKAEQIARGDWQMKRLTKALSLAMGWPSSLERSKTRSVVDPEIW
jgi:hypothetical protein